jgi:hypothetical protein
MFGLVV